MADILSALWQGLAGAFGPQQQPAQQPGQQPQMPPPPSGIAGTLSNPLTQGALSAYLNYIGSPRNEGVGHALEASGLGGLSAFNQARSLQLQPYIQQAQLANLASQTGLHQAQTGLAGARMQQISGIGLANQATANSLRMQIPHLDANVQPRAAMLADTIENDTSKVYDPKEVAQLLYTDPAREKELAAQATLATTRAGEVPVQEAKEKAETAKANAEKELVEPRKKAMEASAESARARARALNAGKPLTDAQIETAANQAGRAAITGMKAGMLESETTFEARKQAAFQEAHDQAKQQLMQQRSGGRAALAASPEDDVPEGAKPVYDASGTLIGYTHD